MPPLLVSNFLSEDDQQVSLPPGFPEMLPPPRYAIGQRCRWIPSPQTDWGTVIGQIYAPHPNAQMKHSSWSWVYLLLLDSDSPSRAWVVADWVSEEDLEPFLIELTRSSNQEQL